MVSKSKEKKSMNKKTKVVIGAVVLCILIVGGVYWQIMPKGADDYYGWSQKKIDHVKSERF